jgi:precorrin-8X/cobalt-precorrin-8 methylmutase
MTSFDHPIVMQSFAMIDAEIGDHRFSPAEYAIVRRVIHSTADFEFKSLIHISPEAIERGIDALRAGVPIVTDVNMVSKGIERSVRQTFQNPILTAVEQVEIASPGQTRTETGLCQLWQRLPNAIFVIGNAPTALLALCNCIQRGDESPALVIGAPVGFVAVLESKAALKQTSVPQIRVDGRKGGSAVAAAILNALVGLAWDCR